MATVNELITALGFEIKPDAEGKLNEFQSMLDGVVSGGKRLAGIAKEGFERMSESAGHAKGIKDVANYIGMSAESLQRFQYAAARAGVPIEKILSDVQRFHENGMDWSQVLDISNQLKYANPLERMTMAKELGLDPETLSFWSQGSRELKKSLGDALVISDKLLENGVEFEKTTSRISNNWTRIKDKLFLGMSEFVNPAMKKVAETMETKEGEASSMGLSFATGLFGLKGSIKGVAGAIGLIKKGIKLLPFLQKAGTAAAATGATGAAAAEAATATGTAAATGAKAAATGLSVKGALATSAYYAIVYKALYDEGKAFYRFFTSEGDSFRDKATNAINETLEEGNKLDLMYWLFRGIQSTVDAVIPDARVNGKMVVNGGNKTVNVYPQTPMEVRDIINQEDLQPTEDGGYGPIFD